MRIGDMASSAMNAFGVDMLVRANNIANVNTPRFQSQSVSLMTGPQGQGVQVGSITTNTTPGPLVPGYDPAVAETGSASGYVEGSNTDIATEFVHMIATQRGYEANATVIRTEDDVTGTLLDMMA